MKNGSGEPEYGPVVSTLATVLSVTLTLLVWGLVVVALLALSVGVVYATGWVSGWLELPRVHVLAATLVMLVIATVIWRASGRGDEAVKQRLLELTGEHQARQDERLYALECALAAQQDKEEQTKSESSRRPKRLRQVKRR